MQTRTQLRSARRWVIKVGSALLTDAGRGLDVAAIGAWSTQIAQLRAEGCEVLLVSSGAVAAGMSRLDWRVRPRELHRLQAVAAIGQMGLVRAWEAGLQAQGLSAAQVLLTHDDLADRRRYLNARSALRALLDVNVIPIVNENDTVAYEELRLGDNDNLAALVSNLMTADVLVILTDQDGLFDKNPRTHADARLIATGLATDDELYAMAGPSAADGLGRGGMQTKIQAARQAARSGTATVIASGQTDNILQRIRTAEFRGTFLGVLEEPLAARKRWLAGQLKVAGRLVIDAGAERVLRERGGSLLAVGVTRVVGTFERGELVSCVTDDNREVARGLVNYSAAESTRILGKSSAHIESLLGYVDEPELIHRDNLALI